MTIISTPIERWLSFISDKSNKFSDQITSLFDLSILIEEIFNHNDCPFSGLEVTINHFCIKFSTKIFGVLTNKPDEKNDPFDKTDARFCIRYELKKKNMASHVWYGDFIKLLTSVWLPDYRKHGQLDFKQDKLKHLLPVALEKLSQKSPLGIYCVFADLDKFGIINKEIGQSEGDKAIQNVLGCIESIAQNERLICMINGGDEYVIFFENKGEFSLLHTLDTLRKLISEPTYGKDKLNVGVTFGIHKLERYDEVNFIEETINKADQATKKENKKGVKEKNRGTVSFYESSSFNISNIESSDKSCFIKLAISLIISRQNLDAPFSNELLNFISRVAFNFYIKAPDEYTGFSEYINEYIKWLGINFSEKHHELELIGDSHCNTQISKVSFTIAIAHGILKSKSKNAILLKTDNNRFLLTELNGEHIIWGDNLKDDSSATPYEIGTSEKNIFATETFSNCALIIIDSQRDLYITDNISLPHNIFADIIVVDSRPNTGGGLPDFWQAAIAQLINIISEKNIDKVLVYGNEACAPKLVGLLKNSASIGINEITELTASPRVETEKCINFIKNNESVIFCQSIQDVISQLYLSMLKLKCDITPHNSFQKKPYLTRVANLHESQLPLIHGMQCLTAAIAYPSILELLRSNDDNEINTFDNADKLLKEIIGFKLLLDSPSKDKIPDYWMRSKDELKEYAQSVLIAESGLIGGKLNEHKQFITFLNHLADYCKPDLKVKTSTRRAILIIPNQFDSNDMKPLGLVSIWVTPRFRDNGYILDYCFVWRTVEALVGLPYSLYGSIKLAEHIKREIDNQFGFSLPSESNLKIGKLTYIALSLHMKVDEYTKRIAKSIVDAASM